MTAYLDSATTTLTLNVQNMLCLLHHCDPYREMSILCMRDCGLNVDIVMPPLTEGDSAQRCLSANKVLYTMTAAMDISEGIVPVSKELIQPSPNDGYLNSYISTNCSGSSNVTSSRNTYTQRQGDMEGAPFKAIYVQCHS